MAVVKLEPHCAKETSKQLDEFGTKEMSDP